MCVVCRTETTRVIQCPHKVCKLEYTVIIQYHLELEFKNVIRQIITLIFSFQHLTICKTGEKYSSIINNICYN